MNLETDVLEPALDGLNLSGGQLQVEAGAGEIADSAEELSPPPSPESVPNLAEARQSAKRRYDAIILRLSAYPVHELLEATQVLSEHFRPPSEPLPGHPDPTDQDSLLYAGLKGSLYAAQLDYGKALSRFAKVTNRLRIPFAAVFSKLHKRDSSIVIHTVTHVKTGITSSSFIPGNEEHLASLQSLLEDVRDKKIDLEQAKMINGSSLTNYYELWVPGPEVLSDASLAKRIIRACPAEATNGSAEYTMLPLYTTKIASSDSHFMPKVTTLQSKNGPFSFTTDIIPFDYVVFLKYYLGLEND